MKKNIIVVLFTITLCFYGTPLFSQATKEVVVSFANSQTPFNLTTFQAYVYDRYRVKITVAGQLECIPNTYLLTLTGTLDGIIATVDYIGTRPNGGSQNGNTGSHDLSNATFIPPPPPSCKNSQDSINAYSTCRSNSRTPVLMAVIDDGIGKTFVNNECIITRANPSCSTVNGSTFFQPYIWTNPTNGAIGYNFVNNTTDPTNVNARHGSAVTYRIVDMLRKAGVDNVRIMILQALQPSATPKTVSSTGSVWNVCRALDFAYCKNANIINMSIGGLLGKINANPERLETAGTSVFEVVFEYMRKTKGTLIVAAAGNDGVDVTIPRPDGLRYCTASYQLPNLLEVAANARCSDNLAYFSNNGAPNVHLSAPGETVYCAVPTTVNTRGIDTLSGTSLAAPHVAAAAAILATNRPPNVVFNYEPIVKSIISGVNIPITVKAGVKVPALQGLVSSKGRLNTCQALEIFMSNYPVIRMVAPASNTEGGTKTAINGLTIAPNPVNSDFTVLLNSTQDAQTELIIKDVLGRTLIQQDWSIYSGENTLSIDASKLNKGIYFINMRIGEQNLTQKMIKN
jgi:hypothetical protein